MKKTVSKIFIHGFSLIILSVIFAPLAFAEVQTTIDNPLGKGVNSIPALVAKLMNVVAMVGGVVVVFFIIYAGFKFVEAQGNPGKLEKARDTLLYTVIGAAVLLGADVIANVVAGTINSIKN
ncbi:MAG: hypothetical protein WCO10_03750 [bacterium]